MELPMLNIEQNVSLMAACLGKQYSAKGMLERCNKVQETFAVKQGFVKKPSSKIMWPNEQSAACNLTMEGQY